MRFARVFVEIPGRVDRRRRITFDSGLITVLKFEILPYSVAMDSIRCMA
jgi:hypothetical protein